MIYPLGYKDNNFYPYYTIKGINYFATTQIIPYGIFMLKRQEAGRSSLLAAVMPSKGDGAGTDTFRPHCAYGQLRNTENRQRLRGLATASLMPHRRLIAVPLCSLSLLPDKDFFDRPATCRLFQQSMGRDSDHPPSCVVGLSQTRPAGTGKYYIDCMMNLLAHISA